MFDSVKGIRIVRQSLVDGPAGDDWLTPWECDYAATRRVPKRRKEWRLGRWTAKLAVREWTGSASPAEIEIRPRADGAPEAFIGGAPADCSISLSHSNGQAICAIAPSGTSIGCDIEVIEARDAAFAADYFTADECAFVESVPKDARALATTLIWSAKECALKAIGEGLRLDTREVEVVTSGVTVDDGDASSRQIEVVRINPRTSYPGWWRLDWPFVIAVVASVETTD